MSLIICPECKHEISDKAPCCIHCGFPINQPNIGDFYLSSRDENRDLPTVAAVYIGDKNSEDDSAYIVEAAASWSVELFNVGSKKIRAIKVTTELFHLGLAEAKTLIEQPRIIIAHSLTAERAHKIAEEYKINGIDAKVIKEV